MEALQEYSGRLRKYLRRWLGIAAIQRQVRDLEGQMAVLPDLERLNAATSRIAARVASLLNQLDDALANDEAVANNARAEALAQASSELRPLVDQLEALGADASQPVPEPSPEQVPVETGPDVPAVVETPDAGAPADQPAPSDVEGGAPADGGAVATAPGTQVPEETAPAPGDVPATAAGEAGGESVPGAPTDNPGQSDFSRPADGSTGTENT